MNEEILKQLCEACGWQGGTIHQVIEEIKKLKSKAEPNWIVNSMGELGVEVNNRQFFLYKGDNIEYENKDGKIKYRSVGKREFGEVCHPFNWWDKQGNPNFPDKKPYSVEISWNGLSEMPEDCKWRTLPSKE